MHELDLSRPLPGLQDYTFEIEQRLAQIARMLAGEAPQTVPKALELAFDREQIGGLSHFHRAAVAVNRSRLQDLEQLTASLFDVVRRIKGFGEPLVHVEEERGAPRPVLPDPDRMVSVLRILVIAWTAHPALTFIPDLPGK